jgi:predicted transcriptional regulator
MIRLNKREEEIMNVFWKLKKAFPKELIIHLKKPIPPYNTILSMVRKLEKDEFLGHNKIGKSHQYFPLISKKTYQKSMLHHLFKDYFGGSPEKFLSFFMKEEKLSEEEIKDILNNYK